MPEYRTEPELGRGYAILAIRSTLFHKNDRNALPVVIAYHYSNDVDVAVDIAQDKSTGEYTVTKYVRCTDKPACYRAILDLDKKLKKMERSKHAQRCSDGRQVLYELTPADLKDMRKFLKDGSEPNEPDYSHTTHTCPKCGHTFQD